ncbi:MAG: hypothetical protein QOG79_2973 [Mycobacterium sp.]|jgi:hypothetical protein|nr:hypothetical protein [Mycobacterium sp.]
MDSHDERIRAAFTSQAATDPSAAIRVGEAFAGELAGGADTGMRPHRNADCALRFHQLWEVTTARKV